VIDNPKVGDRVSYEDAANPRRYGTIIDRVPLFDGVEWRVRWDIPSGSTPRIHVSDLRGRGWQREMRQYRVALTLTMEADSEPALRDLLGRMLAPALHGAAMDWEEVVVDITEEHQSGVPSWLAAASSDAPASGS
jgi:hypothetical protein